MATITPLAVAALGLLAERPMHPYEMYQLLVDREEDRLLKVRPGSLYHAVDRLAETGLVTPMATERAGNRPERTRFRITDDGRLALTERITEMLASPAAEYPEFPLAIAQAHNLPLDEVRACIRTRIKRLTAERHQYEDGAAAVRERGVPRRFWIDVDYQRAMCDAAISWLERLLDELGSGALSWDEQKPHTHDDEFGPSAGDDAVGGTSVGGQDDDDSVAGSRDSPPSGQPRLRGRPRRASALSVGPPGPPPARRTTQQTRTTHEDHR